MAYLWLKALHVLSVIAWMAGMLYLPRLFVYHAGVEPSSAQSETFKVMERRLLRAIMTPAMILVWATGLTLAWWHGFYTAGWLHAKIGLVILLSGAHGYFSATVRKFRNDANRRSPGFYRVANEIPTLLMIGIVILAVVKPF